ncbi:hypothetical protein AOLI_G00165500 [Acnodon oligacanthus]
MGQEVCLGNSGSANSTALLLWFSLRMIQKKPNKGPNMPEGIVFSPTRELALLRRSPTVLKPVQLMEKTYTRSSDPDRKQQAHLDTLASGFTAKTTACLLDPSIPSRTFCSGFLRSTPPALRERFSRSFFHTYFITTRRKGSRSVLFAFEDCEFHTKKIAQFPLPTGWTVNRRLGERSQM